MKDIYIVGAYSTPFGKHADKSFKDLTRIAYMGALADAGLKSGGDIGTAWFGNILMNYWGLNSLKGNTCFVPLVREGLFPGRSPIFNIEAGCATGGMAILSAAADVLTGSTDLALAIGVEKLYDPANPGAIFSLFNGNDPWDPEVWQSHYKEVGEYVGKPFNPSPERTVNMDTYAMQALLHMKQFGTTAEQIAVGAAKNHCNGALNPNAQYRFQMTPDQVLADRKVTEPLTRSMCAPIGDGAAAALVCSGDFLKNQPPEVRRRAVRLAGFGRAGGKYRAYDEPGLTRTAATKAYQMAGRKPSDIQIAEVHDATSFCEIYQCEMMGFCGDGEGGEFVGSGATKLDGSLPVNTSGGLVSKGHPLGATGISMCHELVTQLRGEAGIRQVRDVSIALQENGGGVVGLEEFVGVVMIYEANSVAA
jgi:acetyl-CoA acetyltransferase